MAGRIRARPMLRLLAAGTSRNAMARSLGVPEHSIQAVAEAAEREKVSWRDAGGMEGGDRVGSVGVGGRASGLRRRPKQNGHRPRIRNRDKSDS